jgi:hypothetical protein
MVDEKKRIRNYEKILRLVANLKIVCQTLSRTTFNITDYLIPNHVQIALKATLSFCHIDEVKQNLKARKQWKKQNKNNKQTN